MNATEKQALIGQVVDDRGRFETILSDESRRWFVDRLIRSLQAGNNPISDGDILAKVLAVVASAKSLVTQKVKITLKNLSLESDFDAWYKESYVRRVEVIYGAIATDPTLAEGDLKYLDLVIRRRYRAMARMALWVNGGGEPPLYQYPGPKCPAFRINKAAEPLWNVAPPHILPSGSRLPRWTINMPAVGAVTPSLEKLWTPPTADCEGNVLECATAMTTVLMDSLLEAKDPDTLLRALAARGSQYLAICNPTLLDASPNFVLDGDPRHVFTSAIGSMVDLQLGDYVYVWNHPLYTTFEPSGAWHGEHAVVSACRNRDLLTGFQVSGHGVPPRTIGDLRSRMIRDLQTALALLFVFGVDLLAYLEAGVSSPDVTVYEQQVSVEGTPVQTFVYLFERGVSYACYASVPASTKSLPRFVAVWMPGLNRFGYHRSEDIAEAIAHPLDSVWFHQLPGVAPEARFDPESWVIPYEDQIAGATKSWQLFRREHGRLTIRQIEFGDMPTPSISAEPGRIGVRMVQPTHRPTLAGVF